jgi:hypothetical protein
MDGGRVAEIIPATVEIEGREVPLAERYHPDFVTALVEVPAGHHVTPGWHWDGAAFAIPPAPSVTEVEARARRDALLAGSDWTQLSDAPLSAEAKAAWASYRVALRGLPGQPGFPSSVIWPEPPAE